MQLKVREGQRLHMPDVRGGIIGRLLARPQVGSQFCNGAAWAEAGPQQPAGVKSQPLRSVDCLASIRFFFRSNRR
jgi:hypothetical protein